MRGLAGRVMPRKAPFRHLFPLLACDPNARGLNDFRSPFAQAQNAFPDMIAFYTRKDYREDHN
ncbi:hypothetical protein ASG39_05720 [Rhizobium sp. Leaf371]|nr:hypothetical protein ASG39_05720 [Rhizobium sp. Leaf371]